MKFADLGIVFAMLFLCLMVPDYQKAMETKAIARLQSDYNRALDQAVEDAVSGMVEKDDGRFVWFNKDEMVRRFFTSLAINMEKMEDFAQKELLYHYVPVIAVMEKERFYLGWNLKEPVWQEYEYVKDYGERRVNFTLGTFVIITDLGTGKIEAGDYRDLREKYPFSFFWEEERRNVIVGLLTRHFNETLARQNETGKKYGIAYEFMLPVVEVEEWYRTIDDVGIVAFFQGYPYGNGYSGYYNRVALGGARLHKK